MRLIDADALRQAILSIMPERSEVLLIVDNQPEAVIRCSESVYKKAQINEIYGKAAQMTFTIEEQELLLDLVCNYISEYVFKTTPQEHKNLLLSILKRFGADDEYYRGILGGKENE